MIYGIFHKNKERVVAGEELTSLIPTRLKGKRTGTFTSGRIALGTVETGIPALDRGIGIAFSQDKKLVVAVSGNIFRDEAGANEGDGTPSANTAEQVLRGYQARGRKCFTSLNGQFAVAIWDASRGELLLSRDHLGFEPLFFWWNGETLIFSSSLKSLARQPQVQREYDVRAIRNYLLFNYNPGLQTFIKKVKKVRPGFTLTVNDGELNEQRYWELSYRNQNGKPLQAFSDELVSLTRDAIKIRVEEAGTDPGSFLSGGMDSSSVVGLLSDLTDRPRHTFSFRCDNKDVDESYYARVMAEHYNTEHNEVPFTAAELQHLSDMTAWMEEPLCDIGVELGSFILGRAAHGLVEYILTGDGGDELYAGHPVYLADQIAEKFDRVPAPLRKLITTTAEMLPDSDRKKSLLVKTRRFAYSYDFPAELLSNRWRIYYKDDELADLFVPELAEEMGARNSYTDITGLYADADGPDILSRSLYGDYQTLVHFHVDRLRLTRASGIQARFPLHDYRLIEFSATIPNDMKIRGSKVKYIQHKALEGILPDEIVFRKDKMGHNVPMKNWMRETSQFRDLMRDVLSPSAIKSRNFFRPEVIETMLDAHLRKAKDYSHRLYALLVLELWFQNNIDD